MLACANNHIFSLIQLHYLLWLYPAPIKANIILGFMALFALHYQYVEIIVCWEIKLHYCVSFSCLINNDGWLLFSSPPATIWSLLPSPPPCELKNERINKEIKWGGEEPGAIHTRKVLVAEVLCIWSKSRNGKCKTDTLKVNTPLFIHLHISCWAKTIWITKWRGKSLAGDFLCIIT